MNTMETMRLRLIILTLCALMCAPLAVAGPLKEGDAPTPSGLPVPRFVSLRHAKINARVGPSMEHPIKWTYHQKGLPVQITAETEEWRRIRDPNGDVVWVRREMLSGTRTVIVTGKGEAVLRKTPSESAPARATLDPGVVLTLKTCGAGWCNLKVDGRDGWLPTGRLWGLEPGERSAP